jgi:hypothetical protein
MDSMALVARAGDQDLRGRLGIRIAVLQGLGGRADGGPFAVEFKGGIGGKLRKDVEHSEAPVERNRSINQHYQKKRQQSMFP